MSPKEYKENLMKIGVLLGQVAPHDKELYMTLAEAVGYCDRVKGVDMKVYMVNVETYYEGYGTTRCLGGIFDSLEKAEKYCNDLKEKIKETDPKLPKLAEELEYYIDEVNLNCGHSLSFSGWDNACHKPMGKKVDFEEDEIVLGGYIE